MLVVSNEYCNQITCEETLNEESPRSGRPGDMSMDDCAPRENNEAQRLLKYLL